MWNIWPQKTDCWELNRKPNTELKQEEKEVGVKVKGKFDISKVKCYHSNQLGYFAKDCLFPDKRIKKEEDQYQPSAFAIISMDEGKDNAQTEEVIQSEEKVDKQNNVQDDAQVPMTFEEMLLRCEEQVDSSCDSNKIKLATWDITVTPATQDIQPNMDCDKDSQRISRDRREHEEQRRRCHGMDMSMYQVDTQFQNHMVRCTYKEMKIQDCQDNNKENVSIKQEMDKQPNRGKRKCDDDEDDRKPAAKPKTFHRR